MSGPRYPVIIGRPPRVSPLAAYAVIQIAVDDGAVAWVACPCGCGEAALRAIGARGLRAVGGCSRVVGEA